MCFGGYSETAEPGPTALELQERRMAYFLLVGVLTALSTYLIFRRPQDAGLATGLTVGALTFVPLNSNLTAQQLSFGLACVAVLAVSSRAFWSSRRIRASVLMAYGVGLQMAVYALPLGRLYARIVVFGIVFVLIARIAGKVEPPYIRSLTSILLLFLCFHAMLALSELLGAPPLLPMEDGSTSISLRPNEIVATLPGRPISTFGHPIPLATFALLVGVLSLHQWLLGRRKYLLGLLLALTIIVVAGSRSALIALVVSGVMLTVFVLVKSSITRALVTLMSLGLGFATTNSSIVLAAVGLGSDLTASSSYLHRASVLASFPRLFEVDLAHIIFGWGLDRSVIFSQGLVVGYLRYARFFDNQFVASMAMFGLVGFFLLAGGLVAAYLQGGAISRSLVIAYVFMGFSFDYLQFSAAAVGLALICCIPSSARGSEKATRAYPTARFSAPKETLFEGVKPVRDRSSNLVKRRGFLS